VSTDAPRIGPLAPDEWPEELGPILDVVPEGEVEPVASYNIFRTFARHPDLLQSWLPFAGRLLAGSTLPVRDRELLILRTAVRCGSPYEWGQHVRISLGLEIDRESIDRVPDGADAEGWSLHEAALMRAVDELHESSRLSDATWETLAETYDERQMIEATILVGHYHLVAFALNSFGVELDDGLEALPGEAD
jgi:alkylhydroperoxidase family enzyme